MHRPVNNCKNRDYRFPLAVTVAVMAALVVLVGACHRHMPAPSHSADAHYCAADSLLRTITTIDSVTALVDRYHNEHDAVGEMLALKYQGKLMRGNAMFGEAVKAHTRMYHIATSLQDTIEMILALDNIATNYRRMGELSSAYTYHYDALRLSDAYSDHESDEAVKSRVVTLNGIGNIELGMCNYATADTIFRQALAGEKKLGSNVGMAINYANLGFIKHRRNEIDSAWAYYRKSLEYNKLAGSELGVALCHLHFGELHESDRRFSHAREEYQVAYDGLKEIDRWHWLEACLALSSVCIKLGDVADAHDYVAEAEAEALRINSREHQARAYKVHYELALLEGDPDKALKYFVHSDELADSINGPERTDEMRTQRLDYERNLKSGELSLLNNNIAHLKRMRNLMIAAVSLMLLMAGAIIATLVYANRVRSRTQRVMHQIEETRSLFFTNVVHRLRTPLTAIMGAIDSIIADSKSSATPPSAQQLVNLEMIDRQGGNLLELVDRILEVGSVRSAVSDLDWRTGNVVPFIRMIIESYREQCVSRQIELTYASSQDRIVMDAVPSYLSTIVGSLVENAINYSRDYSKITVTTRQEGDELVIRVADNGMGISSNDLPHVFEPFYRGALAEQITEGVGIGLTVVRDMVMALGGSVAVDSKKDNGSVFTITLPCKHNDGVKDRLEDVASRVLPKLHLRRTVKRSEASVRSKPAAGDDKPVVLVVEDHGDVAQLVGSVLAERFAVHYASDGEQGLARAVELVPDLIVTDVKMPAMDGCELCRRVRQSPQLCHIPVIMLSARTGKDDRIAGIKAGADVYMVKPFVSEEMIEWANRLLQNRQMFIQHYSDTLSNNGLRAASVGKTSDNSEDEKFMARFNELVSEQITSGVTRVNLDKVAVSMKMGESAMRRKVQSVTGKNVIAHITDLRMDKALDLLRRYPDMLIGEVAEQCGFADVAYFSRVFRQHYGMTPTRARNGDADKS